MGLKQLTRYIGLCSLRRISCQLAMTIQFQWARSCFLCCIMMEIRVNVGKFICEHLTIWVRHPRGAKSFLLLIEQLCIKACPELEKSPQVEVSGGVCTKPTLLRIIAIYKNKTKLKCLKTKQEGQKEAKMWILKKKKREKKKKSH